VKDLAASLGTKPANIYAWFPDCAEEDSADQEDSAKQHYRLEGSLAQKHLAGPVAKAPKAPKSSESDRKAWQAEHASSEQARRNLASRILGALKSAGKKVSKCDSSLTNSV
jgi:hypothetical protein